ncbi:glycosyltransferase family 4 protein [Bradyrhizobium vignae]|uniref:Glycosyltransferase family 4 protein n=1 Tax=Bradyrhizobium vignae TaxID=1549949 RepID=A0ABS3ZQA3_9BRAD|nr:glycosyltransferase family 4 protein [Bradyrhizobium vignae]MBP0110352.1 glycosyltransferase family 4 protein [Bradyrhizobium vignae]
MNIVHVITSFGLGGAERVAADVAAAQVASGHHATIVALRRTPVGQEGFATSMLDELTAQGVRTIKLESTNFRQSIPYLIFALRKLVLAELPDILHAHADPADFIVALTSRLTAIPVVRTIHNTSLWPTHFMAGCIAEHAFKREAVIAVSRDAMMAYEKLRSRYGLASATIREVIYNGVPIGRRSVAKTGHGLRMAFFGRSAPQKGLDVLLDALAIVAERQTTRSSFTIFTDVRAPHNPSNGSAVLPVSFRPPTPQARQIMADYDVVIVPSRFEGLPLVPLEAMAAGVPVLMTDAPGLREVTPPGWPLTCPIEDARALAERIDEIGAGRYNLIELGERARIFAKGFSVEQQVERYLKVYETLLAG